MHHKMEKSCIFYSDGSVYTGNSVNEQPTGHGTLKLHMGIRLDKYKNRYAHFEIYYNEEWKDGKSDEIDVKNKVKANGYCIIENKLKYESITFKGNFINGKLNGFIVINTHSTDEEATYDVLVTEEMMFRNNVRYGRIRYINDHDNEVVYKENTDECSASFGNNNISVYTKNTYASYTKNTYEEKIYFGNKGENKITKYNDVIRVERKYTMHAKRETCSNGKITFGFTNEWLTYDLDGKKLNISYR